MSRLGENQIMKQEIAHETKWPYGVGTHYPSIRSWCIRCQESCYDPETSGFGYDALCLCCREPLYHLRIAELEAELAKFHLCDRRDHRKHPVAIYHKWDE